MSEDQTPFPIAKVREHAPWWGLSVDGTRDKIRSGELGVILFGRKQFLSISLLRAYVEKCTTVLDPEALKVGEDERKASAAEGVKTRKRKAAAKLAEAAA